MIDVSSCRSFHLLDISEKKGFFNAKVLFVPNALNISREIQEFSMQSELQITRTQTLMFSSKAHNVLQMRANRK